MDIETAFERFLWSSRYLLIVPVVLSVVVAAAMVYMATVDSADLLIHVASYANFSMENAVREQLHNATIARVAAALDSYLFAAILIVFSLGLYELFISKIGATESSEVAGRLLLIRSIDDLKERLGKVVFLILVVRYFQLALQLPISGPLDLLYLAVGIALLAGALHLTSRRAESGGHSRGG